MDRAEALKAMRLSAEFRSCLSLMRCSRAVSGAHLAAARAECSSFLARGILSYPPSLMSCGLRPDQTHLERREVLGLGPSFGSDDPECVRFQEMLATAGRRCLRSNWIWRIGQECRERALEGWFGFFVTLTVDPSRVADAERMWREGREFRRYIRRLGKVAARACGLPRAIHDGASVSDFVRHVGVIEHGASQHHHHMHLLIWMRDIPASWKRCPNRGIRAPADRVHDWCRPMATYWPNSLPGIGRAKFFRHEGDVWSRLGFVLPYDSRRGRIVRVHPPEKAGLYVAKYLDKEDKVWTHRVKATRGLGLDRLLSWLRTAHLRKVEALTWRPLTYSLNTLVTTIHTVPLGLLRSLAKQELFCRRWVSNLLDFRKLLQPNCDSFGAMLKSVQDGARPLRMRSKAFYEWVTSHLPVPDGYCEDRYKRASVSLGVEFRPARFEPVNHIGAA